MNKFRYKGDQPAAITPNSLLMNRNIRNVSHWQLWDAGQEVFNELSKLGRLHADMSWRGGF